MEVSQQPLLTAQTADDSAQSSQPEQSPQPEEPEHDTRIGTGAMRWGAAKAVALRGAQQAAIALAFIGVAVMTRGNFLHSATWFNPDEAELMAQGRAAMHSPVPFTTWTTATTGPFWVLFLALLGWIGFPLTIAFAHLLSAFMYGVLGYLGFTLARRSLRAPAAVIVTGFWWFPLVTCLLAGGGLNGVVNFASLDTEVLPGALVLAASLPRPESIARRPILYFALTGLLSGLAFGSKYQVAPMALAVFAVHVVRVGDYSRRTLVRSAACWFAGLLAPLLLVGLAMLVSGDVSMTAVHIDLNFLSNYSGGLTLTDKLANWRSQVITLHTVLLFAALCWLGIRSSRTIQWCRAALVLSGLLAVYSGGMGFPHYVVCVYVMIAIAIGLPMRPDAVLVPSVRTPMVATAVIALVALVGWVASFGPHHGYLKRTKRYELSYSLSASSVIRDPRLAADCPAGSNVVVWGWAPELYINYDWHNAIPFLNVTQITDSKKNYGRGYTLVSNAIANQSTTCLVDAVGDPFFGMPDKARLAVEYPALATLLDQDYRTAKDLNCQKCTVYVRR
jgi:hypothetical protein